MKEHIVKRAVIIQNILRISIHGRVASNSNMHHNSFAGSDWLVPLLLYQPLLNETNECALLNAFISSRCEKVSERNDIEWSNIDGALPKPKRLHSEKKHSNFV